MFLDQNTLRPVFRAVNVLKKSFYTPKTDITELDTMKKKLKIVRITDSYPPPWSGLGPGPYAISNAQVQIGHTVHVITKHKQGSESIDKNSNVIVHRIKAKSYFFEVLAFIKLMKLEKKNRFDLIHTHGSSFFLFHLFLRPFFKKPVFMSVHTTRKKQYEIYKKLKIAPYGLKERFEIFKEKICINNSDYFFPVSNGLKEELCILYSISIERIKVVDNGIEPYFLKEYNKKNIRKKIRLDEKFTLFFVGTLNGRKNIGHVIHVFKKILKNRDDIQFIVVGSGPLKEHYVKMVECYKLSGNILFVENLDQKDLVDYYRASDVFVFPSYYEGLPKVIIEAMACSLPVVCSNISGNNQLVLHKANGFLYPVEDAISLENGINYMIESKKRAEKMGACGKNAVRKRYTWKKVAENFDKGYEKILN